MVITSFPYYEVSRTSRDALLDSVCLAAFQALSEVPLFLPPVHPLHLFRAHVALLLGSGCRFFLLAISQVSPASFSSLKYYLQELRVTLF